MDINGQVADVLCGGRMCGANNYLPVASARNFQFQGLHMSSGAQWNFALKYMHMRLMLYFM